MKRTIKSTFFTLALFACVLEGTAASANTPQLINSDGCKVTLTGPSIVCTGENFIVHASVTHEGGSSHNVNYPVAITGSTGPTVDPTEIKVCPTEVDLKCFAGEAPHTGTLTVTVGNAKHELCIVTKVGPPQAVDKVTYTEVNVDPAPNFGVTSPENVQYDIGVYTDCPAKKWRVKVIKADSKIETGVNMLGRGEASEQAATAANWRQMAGDITPARLRTNWWKTEAIRAHEEVHINGWKVTTDKYFAEFKTTVEALTEDITCTMDTPEEAKAAILAKAEYEAARNRLDFDGFTEWVNTYDHPASDDATDAAEQAVLAPIRQAIINKAAQNGWN